MNFETKTERGVSTKTARAILRFKTNIITSIAPMVITPVKSCVKPMRSPSAKASTSEIMRLSRSPKEWESIYEIGREWSFLPSFPRRSRQTKYVILLLQSDMKYCESAAASATAAMVITFFKTPEKSTLPFPSMQSIASPVKTGISKAAATLKTAQRALKATKNECGFTSFKTLLRVFLFISFCLAFVLTFVYFTVDPAIFKQLFVLAVSDKRSVVQHKNPVGVFN